MASCDICASSVAEDGLNFHETKYWKIRLGFNQAYLGRALVILKRHGETVSDLTVEEWIELRTIMNWYESRLKLLWNATLFNWTFLTNDSYKNNPANPHAHWHVWPRYDHTVTIDEETFADPNFAHHYDKEANSKTDLAFLPRIVELITGEAQ